MGRSILMLNTVTMFYYGVPEWYVLKGDCGH